MPINTKLGIVVTYLERLLKFWSSLITWSYLIAWQTKNICITTTKIPVVTKFGKVVTYHEELPQGLTYHKEQSTHKFVWPLNEVIVLGHVINWIQYISTCRRPMDTKLGKLQTYQWEAVWPFNYVMHLTWEFEKFIFSLSKYLWPVNQAGCWLIGGGTAPKHLSHHWLLISCYYFHNCFFFQVQKNAIVNGYCHVFCFTCHCDDHYGRKNI